MWAKTDLGSGGPDDQIPLAGSNIHTQLVGFYNGRAQRVRLLTVDTNVEANFL